MIPRNRRKAYGYHENRHSGISVVSEAAKLSACNLITLQPVFGIHALTGRTDSLLRETQRLCCKTHFASSTARFKWKRNRHWMGYFLSPARSPTLAVV